MTDDNTPHETEQPLDPAVERIHIRLRRLLIGSGFIMVLGFVAVFAALYYRITQGDESKTLRPAVQETFAAFKMMSDILPPNIGTLIDVSLGEGHLIASFQQEPGIYNVLIISREDGRIVEQYRWVPKP